MATHLTVALMLLLGAAPSPSPAGDAADPTSQTAPSAEANDAATPPPAAGIRDASTPPQAGASDASTPPPGTAATSDAYAKPPTQGPGDAAADAPSQPPAATPPNEAASQVPPESALTSTPPPAAANEAGNDTISLDDWRRDDWMLVKPKVSMVEIDGYFRLRGDLMRHMDFDNRVNWEVGPPRYQALSDGHADFSSTNMRLRVEPRINITEQLQVVSTIDLLDNLVLGSTPDSMYLTSPYQPVDILSFGQLPPQQNVTSLTNSIVVKRLWGRMTALNEQLELRFGRMPDHFGLGMLYNNGDCLDCDWGLSVDRISLAVRAFDHVFMPMIDWVGRGPQVRPFGAHDPAPIDAVSFDDTMQYALRVMREDHPDDIRDAVNHGRRVINYGLSNAFRWQARYYTPALYQGGTYNPATEPSADVQSPTPDERRDAFLYVGDVYGKYYYGLFELATEVAVQAGYFTDSAINATKPQTSVFKLGGAFEGRYRTRPDGMGVQLSLKGGAASGDNHAGFGALDRADTQRGNGINDTNLHNFQFSPDYHIDLLMFRRMIGAVTDAWYLRPEVAYRFDDKVIGRVNAVYSQAVRGNSTPSATTATTASAHTPMGIEFDAELTYGSEARRQEAQLMASLAGGILFPLGAFNNAQSTQGNSFAWTIQARVYLTF